MEVLLLVAERDGPENAGADCGHESIEPARRESAASAATETGQGFSDCSVIASVGRGIAPDTAR